MAISTKEATARVPAWSNRATAQPARNLGELT